MKIKLLAIAFLTSLSVSAQLQNGGFENGLTNWTLIGNGANNDCFGTIQPTGTLFPGFTGTGGSLYPLEGMNLIKLTAGGTIDVHSLESQLNVPFNSIDTINVRTEYIGTFTPPAVFLNDSPTNAKNGSAITQYVNVQAGQTLTMNIIMSTEEKANYWYTAGGPYIDYSFFTIDGPSDSQAFYLKCMAEYTNCPVLGGSDFGNPNAPQLTPIFCQDSIIICPLWQVVDYTFTQSGMHQIGIGVLNNGDNLYPSELILDNLRIHSAPTLGTPEFTTDENTTIYLNEAPFNNAVSDFENDTIVEFTFMSTPANGTLSVLYNGNIFTITDAILPYNFSQEYLDSIVYVPNTGFIGDDQFQITVLDQQGDASDTNVVIIHVVDPSLGLSTNELQIALFPNPTKTNATIQAIGMNATEIKATVTDANGRAIFTTSGTELDLSKLSTGIYFVEVSYRGATLVERLIKE